MGFFIIKKGYGRFYASLVRIMILILLLLFDVLGFGVALYLFGTMCYACFHSNTKMSSQKEVK